MPPVATGVSYAPNISVPTTSIDNKTVAFQAMIGNKQVDASFVIAKDRDFFLGDIEEPAVIMVMNAKTAMVQYVTNKFFLQSIQQPKMERFQIIETFRESKLFFFGERTKVYTFAGTLFEADNSEALTEEQNTDTSQLATTVEANLRTMYRWSSSLQDLYNKYLRGTKLAENDNIAVLYLSGFMFYGYPLQLQIARDANNNNLVQFQMTWAILREDNLDVGVESEEALYSLNQMGATTKDIAELKKLRAAVEKAKKELVQAEANVTTAQAYWSDLSEEAKVEVYSAKDKALTKHMEAYNAYLAKISSLVQQ